MWLLQVDGRDNTTRLTKDGILVSTTCYTGNFEKGGFNNPQMGSVKDVGPLPVGLYRIEGPPFTHPLRGPYCLRLIPDRGTEMYGRDGMLIHGKPLPPRDIRTGSDGCLCADHDVRMKIYQSADIVLQVLYINAGIV